MIFHLEGGTRVVFNDPRRFGSLDIQPSDALDKAPALATLGIEPLGNALNATSLATLLARTPYTHEGGPFSTSV